ncbi:MAG: prepilin-type N-terminal cleavage/methylation domain-containing protein, partial [Planctomycetes bacterium]|nr:prepilin-type N-terminal cleavage/methylation domain-containing protein [Planctomycetota bacterium]
MGRYPRRFRQGPERRDRGFTLLELLIVIAIICVIAGMSVAFLGGFLKGSTCKHGGRILQGQFFKARQLAASKRMNHYLRIESTGQAGTGQLGTTLRIFEDTNLNRQFNPPAPPGVALMAGEGTANGSDNIVGELVSLPRGSFVGVHQANPDTESAGGITA